MRFDVVNDVEDVIGLFRKLADMYCMISYLLFVNWSRKHEVYLSKMIIEGYLQNTIYNMNGHLHFVKKK